MSFLSDHFSTDMRTLSLERQVKSKNAIGETVDSLGSVSRCKGIIITNRSITNRSISGDVPLNISSHTLLIDYGITIHEDDIIIDAGTRYTVK